MEHTAFVTMGNTLPKETFLLLKVVACYSPYPSKNTINYTSN